MYYLTMPYIEGESLSALLKNGPLPERQTAETVRTLALALTHAHAKGVVHRNLKPQNIMVRPGRGLVVMDFGLARRSLADDSLRTQTGVILDTPAFMAPEQVDGDPQAIGPATNIYALGVILFLLLTKRLPFEGGSLFEILIQIKQADPPRPSKLRPGLDHRLDAICRKAMAKAFVDRYRSMAELIQDLDAFLQPPGRYRRVLVPNRPPSPRLPAARWKAKWFIRQVA